LASANSSALISWSEDFDRPFFAGSSKSESPAMTTTFFFIVYANMYCDAFFTLQPTSIPISLVFGKKMAVLQVSVALH